MRLVREQVQCAAHVCLVEKLVLAVRNDVVHHTPQLFSVTMLFCAVPPGGELMPENYLHETGELSETEYEYLSIMSLVRSHPRGFNDLVALILFPKYKVCPSFSRQQQIPALVCLPHS